MRLSAWILPLLGLPVAVVCAVPALDQRPAAREHVRYVDGQAWRFSSRLDTVVELFFNVGSDHVDGRLAVSAVLERIAAAYGTAERPAFSIRRIATRPDGLGFGAPVFGLEHLLAGEVIVANNVRGLGEILDEQRRKAIRDAVDSAGRGWLSVHGTAETGKGWKWLADTLDPRQFQGFSMSIPVPVYKDLREGNHIVLQGVLATNTDPAPVPVGFTPESGYATTGPVPVRRMIHKFYRWGRDLEKDSSTRDRITVLLRRDSRETYRYVGLRPYINPNGDAHAFLLRVGKAMTSYFPAGHLPEELLGDPNSFDRGEGDLTRYLGQLLFFLAGYDKVPCDARCEGLPLVDAKDHLAGTYTSAAAIGAPGRFQPDDGRGVLYSADGRISWPWRAPLRRFRKP